MKPNLSLVATAATLLLATSCFIKENRIQCQAPVTVSVNTFSISQEDIQITKAAQNVTDIAATKSITLAFFDESGTQIRKIDQLRADVTTYETFGTFSLSLPWGTYKMVVIAHDGENPIVLNDLSDANFETEKPKRPTCNMLYTTARICAGPRGE